MTKTMSVANAIANVKASYVVIGTTPFLKRVWANRPRAACKVSITYFSRYKKGILGLLFFSDGGSPIHNSITVSKKDAS
jgi:hypothetical protein